VINWGSVADWVAGVSTSGTLGAAIWLMRVEQRNRRRDLVDALRATLDVKDPARYRSPQSLVLVITNAGNFSFTNVVVYRKIHVKIIGGPSRHKWYVASVPFLGRFSQYEWVILDQCLLTTGRKGHSKSFMTFDFRGRSFIRHAGRMPEEMDFRTRRLRDETVSDFRNEAGSELVELEDDSVSYRHIDGSSREMYW
jgi:hypothetical protein